MNIPYKESLQEYNLPSQNMSPPEFLQTEATVSHKGHGLHLCRAVSLNFGGLILQRLGKLRVRVHFKTEPRFFHDKECGFSRATVTLGGGLLVLNFSLSKCFIAATYSWQAGWPSLQTSLVSSIWLILEESLHSCLLARGVRSRPEAVIYCPAFPSDKKDSLTGHFPFPQVLCLVLQLWFPSWTESNCLWFLEK